MISETRRPVWMASSSSALSRLPVHVERSVAASRAYLSTERSDGGCPTVSVAKTSSNRKVSRYAATVRYAHLTPDSRQDAIDRLEGALGDIECVQNVTPEEVDEC